MAPKKGAAASPDALAMYGDEYDALREALATPSFRMALANYCESRRRGAGETMLFPSMTPDQLQIIRGKAHAFFELLAVCETAKTEAKGED